MKGCILAKAIPIKSSCLELQKSQQNISKKIMKIRNIFVSVVQEIMEVMGTILEFIYLRLVLTSK